MSQSIAIENDFVSNFAFPSAKAANETELSSSTEEGWRLVRAFLHIRETERRRAVLEYVVVQAKMDTA
jgi:hypothetical protein